MLKQRIRSVLHRFGVDVKPYQRPEAEAAIYRAHHPEEAIVARRFYNVGAGGFRHPYWTNIDKASSWYAAQQRADMIDFDLMSRGPLPLPDAKAEVFYTSHTIEHIDDEAAANLFGEVRRCLRPGGVLRVTCPNIDLDHRAWRTGDRSHFYWAAMYSRRRHMRRAKVRSPMNEASLEQLFLHHFVGSASTLHADGVDDPMSDDEVRRVFDELPYEQALDACVRRGSMHVQAKYPGNHINWWNPAKVERALAQAGFERIVHSAYGQSRAAVLRNTDLFDNTHPKISLYVDALR